MPLIDRKAIIPAAFFVLVPCLIGVLLGASRTGVAFHLPWIVGVGFWVGATLGVWLFLYAGSAIAGVLLRPWHPPLWLILLVGAVAGSLPARQWIYFLAAAVGDQMQGRKPQPAPPLQFSWDFALFYLQVWVGVWVLWVVVGIVFERWFGFPRYSRSPGISAIETATTPAAESGPAEPARASDEPQPASATGAFMERLPDKLGRNVLALQAEDHYVRVYTDRGNALVLYRFSDAITDLGPMNGIRVHRSFWVRKEAVQSVATQGKGMLLTLSNGLTVPVSQAYKALAREAGLNPEA